MRKHLDLEEILPKRIKVGYMYYDVLIRDEKWGDENDADGSTKVDRQIINIVDSWDILQVIDTLKHEILHACWDYFYLPAKASEEDAVSRLSTGLTQVELDNPEYVALLNLMHAT